MNDQEKLLLKRVTELANISYLRGVPTFSDFLTLAEQNIVSQLSANMPPIIFKMIGGYNLAERRVAAFYPDDNFADVSPIVSLKISPLNKKFSEELTHRDYLGALINLGIDRSVLGDIVVDKDSAYLFCLEKISSFIISELTRIKHTPVMAVIEEFDDTANVNKEEISGTVSSLRIDSMLSLVTNISRSKAVTYIEEAKVFVNGKLITSNSYQLKENDIISVRGIGKFQYKEISGVTKKGKYYVVVDKYC